MRPRVAFVYGKKIRNKNNCNLWRNVNEKGVNVWNNSYYYNNSNRFWNKFTSNAKTDQSD